MRTILVLSLLLGAAAQAAEKLELTFDPPAPPPGQMFRVKALVPGVPCGGNLKVATNFPGTWLALSESKVTKKEGCLVVEVVSSRDSATTEWPGLKISAGLRSFESGARTVAFGGAASAAGPSKVEQELGAYLAQLRTFVAAYVVGAPAAGPGFSIESCRTPVKELVMGLLNPNAGGNVKTLKFKPGCDLQGRVEERLDTPVPFDLQVRNLASIDQIKGVGLMQVKRGDGMNLELYAEVTNGEAFAKGTSVMKFSFEHRRHAELNLASMSLRDIDNKGTLKITEFRGQAADHVENFVGQNWLVIKHTPGR